MNLHIDASAPQRCYSDWTSSFLSSVLRSLHIILLLLLFDLLLILLGDLLHLRLATALCRSLGRSGRLLVVTTTVGLAITLALLRSVLLRRSTLLNTATRRGTSSSQLLALDLAPACLDNAAILVTKLLCDSICVELPGVSMYCAESSRTSPTWISLVRFCMMAMRRLLSPSVNVIFVDDSSAIVLMLRMDWIIG